MAALESKGFFRRVEHVPSMTQWHGSEAAVLASLKLYRQGVCSAAWRLGQPLSGDDATHIDVCGLGLGLAGLAR